MKEVLVSLETAKLLKEKGFNGKSFYHYHYDTDNERFTLQDNSIQLFIGCEGGLDTEDHLLNQIELDKNGNTSYNLIAPTQSLAQKWLRDVHKLIINVIAKDDNIWTYTTGSMEGFINIDGDYEDYPTYEEALETALQETLKYYI